MVFGYARVSTREQQLERQIDALAGYACAEILTEKMTGVKADRPELISAVLTPETKNTLRNTFPFAYRIYQRRFVLHTLGLQKYYNKADDSLHIHQSVLSMNVICSPELRGIFNSEFADIVQPFTDEHQLPFNEGPYEIDEMKLCKGDVVFDCGANLGMFSAMAANYDCVSYAFEPLPSNIEYLNKIIRVNSSITLAPYAVGDEDGTVQFELANEFSTSTGISQEHGNGVQTITVNIITLDTFAEQNGIERVDFIKADIEGAERLMLKGAKGILAKDAPKLSLCTYHLPDHPQVLRELILEANPRYKIIERYKKLYAYVPDRQA